MAQASQLPADFAESMANPTPHRSRVAERLLAHARLCRQMACASVNEALGEQLLAMADRCMREAAEAIVAEKTTGT